MICRKSGEFVGRFYVCFLKLSSRLFCEGTGLKMNKKFAIILLSLLVVMIFIMRVQSNLAQASGLKMQIPKHAIRLRILANSNSAADQKVKRDIRDSVNADVETWVQHLKSINQAKQVIRHHIPELKQVVQEKLDKEGVNEAFTVKLGPAKFPTKLYGGYVYPAGTYNALVITLGSGKGANWWCVLFPPLCFLDFEHGDAVKPDQTATQGTSSGTKATVQTSQSQMQQVKVKFFFVDFFQHVFSRLFSWL